MLLSEQASNGIISLLSWRFFCWTCMYMLKLTRQSICHPPHSHRSRIRSTHTSATIQRSSGRGQVGGWVDVAFPLWANNSSKYYRPRFRSSGRTNSIDVLSHSGPRFRCKGRTTSMLYFLSAPTRTTNTGVAGRAAVVPIVCSVPP